MGRIFAVLASCISLFVYWYNPSLLQRLDLLAQDTVFNLRPAPSPSRNVIVVAVDEKSVKQYGRWPWPRALQGLLISRIKELGARVIALDIIYMLPQDRAQDAALIKGLSAPGGKVVGGYFFRGARTFPEDLESLSILWEQRILNVFQESRARLSEIIRFPFVEANQPETGHAFSSLGFFQLHP